ncbi:MAG TPA: DUF917 family protein [Sulfolobales archaeon]|nr:DUF917 family protein [Sulfolobales archaeon]
MAIYIDSDDKMEDLVLGSGFLGGGGGGDLRLGLELGRSIIRLGIVEIRSIDDVDKDSIVVTTSAVGPQSADSWKRSSLAANLAKAVKVMVETLNKDIEGLISSEIGAINTLSPFPASLFLDIPVIDAPCNGRAHPTVLMGSMGLHRILGYITTLTAIWGDAGGGIKGRAVLKGSLGDVINTLRAIVQLKGSVATARNPINAGYIKTNAAPGSISLAMEIGSILRDHRSTPREASHNIARKLSGKVIEGCAVLDNSLEVREGLDVGRAEIACNNRKYVLTYANEYMYLESGGEIVSTFPDLVSLIDLSNGLPLLSKDLVKGSRFDIVIISWRNLKLGSGVKYPEAYEQVMKALGTDIRMYIKDLLVV